VIDLQSLSYIVQIGAVPPIIFALWKLDRRLLSIETVLLKGNHP
jgi:hypothetical protein